jgi:ABC-type nitrate/sulfonate/bicarbonate transport system permease component
MSKYPPTAWFHLISTIAWIPLTVLIFLFGIQSEVWLILLLSVYANLKTDWGALHAAIAADEGD